MQKQEVNMDTPQAIPGQDENFKLGGLRAGIVFTAAAIFYLYEYLVRVAPSVMVSELEFFFGASTTKLSASFATYYYIYSPMQLIVGVLFDRFGGRKLFIPASLVVAVGCFVATMPGFGLVPMTFGRFLMGLGSAFGFVGVLYLATLWYPANRLAFLSGLTTGLGMIGAIMGETVLSGIVDNFGWEWCFIGSGIFGLFVTLLLFFVIPRGCPREKRQIKAMKEDNTHFVSGLVSVVKNPQTWVIGFVGACLYFTLSVFADMWGVQYIMNVSSVSKTTAATAVAMLYIGWFVGGPVSGWLSDYYGNRKRPMFWGLILTGLLLWLLILVPEWNFKVLCALLFVIGLTSSTEIISFIAGFEANSPSIKGTSIAVVNMVIMLLGGFIQNFAAYILQSRAAERSFEEYADALTYTANDYRAAMVVLPVMMFVGAFACYFMKETYDKNG